MKTKKIISLLMCLCMALTLLAGCSGKPAPAAPAEDNGGTTADDAVHQELMGGKKVTLKMLEHANEATNKAVKELNAKFKEKYPNVTVQSQVIGTAEYGQAMQTGLAANNIDIFEFGCFNIANPDYTKGLDKNGNILYIENGDILELTGQGFVGNWSKSAQENAMTYDGKVWCVPSGTVATNVIFYNKQIFADQGISVPKSWDEFTAACKKLQAAGIAPMTEGGKDGWPVTMAFDAMLDSFEDSSALAKGLWTGERKWNDAQNLENYRRMWEYCTYFEEGVMSVDYASVIGRFIAGKAAMLPDGSWDSANIALADPEFDYGVFTFPRLDGGVQCLNGKYDLCYAGAAKSKNAEAIMAWLDFYSQPETYQPFISAIGFIPAMDGITVDSKFMKEAAPYMEDFQLNFGIKHRAPKGIGQYAGFTLGFGSVLGGEVASADELADLAQKDWDDAMSKIQ